MSPRDAEPGSSQAEPAAGASAQQRAPEGPPARAPRPSDAGASSAPGELRLLLAHTAQILHKDLRQEWRSREIVYTMTLFAALLVMIFSFAFIEQGEPMSGVAAGILWVAVAFAGTLALGRYFEREREADTITALLLSPASRAAIYLAKLLGIAVFMLITEAVLLPLLIVLFEIEIAAPGLLIALLLLGTVGFAAVGSLFAAGLMRSSSRDVLLGVLTFPIVLPVIIAGAKGTAALIGSPAELDTALTWLKLMLAFDAIFVVLSLWAFGPLVSNE